MPISHGHKPYEYPEFVPELEAKDVIDAVKLKQNLYDEGLSQVMLKRDELYNLNISKDVDREYVAKAIDNYNRVIKDNAHMDFSNPNTVRSLLQVSAPLEQDPLVRNAIASTKELQNRQKTLSEIAQKNPKYYSEANAYEYLKDAQDWQNNKEVGALLQPKEYVPYEDLSGISKRVADKKGEITEKYKKMGAWYSKEQIEELTTKEIQDYLNVTLTDKEKNQMRIDSQFEGLRIDDNTKKQVLSENYVNAAQIYKTASQNKNYTPEERENYKNYYEAATETAMEIMNADKNKLTDLFANYYTSNYIKGIGDFYSYKNTKQEMIADPSALAAQASALRRKEADLKLERDKQLLAYKYENGFVGKDEDEESTPGVIPSIITNDKDNKNTFSKIQNGEEVTTAYENLDNTVKNKITNAMGSKYDPKGDLVILKKKGNDLIAVVEGDEIPLETFNNKGSNKFEYVDFFGDMEKGEEINKESVDKLIPFLDSIKIKLKNSDEMTLREAFLKGNEGKSVEEAITEMYKYNSLLFEDMLEIVNSEKTNK